MIEVKASDIYGNGKRTLIMKLDEFHSNQARRTLEFRV
jgi:hypothetical protein